MTPTSHHQAINQGNLRRPLENQFALFITFLSAQLIFSFYLLLKSLEIGGTMPWIAILHPILTWLTIWPMTRDFLLGRNWLTLPNVVLLLIYLETVLGSAHYVLRFDKIRYGHQLPDIAAQGVFVVLIGTIAFRLGVKSSWLKPIVRKLPPMPTAGPWSPGIRFGVCGAILVSLLIRLYLDFTGMWGYGTTEIGNLGVYGILQNLSVFGRAGLAIGFFYWFSSRPFPSRDKYLLCSAFGLFLAQALLSGSKANTVLLLLLVFIPYQLLKTAKALKVTVPLAIKIIAASLVLFIFLLNRDYRKGLLEVRPRTMAERAAVAFEKVDRYYETEMEEGNPIEAAIEIMVFRFSVFPLLLTALDQTPSRIDFRRWDRYYLIPLMLTVPRIVWPDKPQISGLEFKRLYMNPHATDSAGPGFIGYAYLENGFLGVFALLFLIGITVEFLQLYTVWKHGLTPASVALFVVFSQNFGLMGDPIGLWAGQARVLIPFALAYYAIFAFSKPAANVPTTMERKQ